MLNAAVGVWQSKSAEGSLDALKKMQPSLATVIRGDRWLDEVDATILVPGDVISVRVGDKVGWYYVTQKYFYRPKREHIRAQINLYYVFMNIT